MGLDDNALRSCLEELQAEQARLRKAKIRDASSMLDDLVMLGDILEHGVHGGKLPSSINRYTREILAKHGLSEDLIHQPFQKM